MTHTLFQASRWKQAGRVSLWRYTEHERNFRGWHLNGDQAGCASLVQLLKLLVLDGLGHRTIEVTPPTDAQLRVPNNWRGQAAWVAPAKLRFAIDREPGKWVFPPELMPATLTFGANWLGMLSEGISGIPTGKGDYSIGHGADDLPLWFWW
jgi:hypothetical protein